jgi:hypothetical protein
MQQPVSQKWAGIAVDKGHRGVRLIDGGLPRVLLTPCQPNRGQTRVVPAHALVATDGYGHLRSRTNAAGCPFRVQECSRWQDDAQELLALMGFAIGELWDLGRLADARRADERLTCLITSAPLNVVGGVSTPANALSIR